jgi:hypothetical protein
MAGQAGQVGYSKRSRLDKLGVKPGARVAVVGLDDEAFLAELRERTSAVTTGRLPRAADLVIIYMERPADLARLAKARTAIAPSAGLVDVKVVAFSETLSGLKLVVPLRDRR